MEFLRDIRVVEATSYISGPFAGLMFADLGAEVVKFEAPPHGDPFRRFGRRVNGLSVLFSNINRGKRSVLGDLKTPEGLESLHDLLASSDLLVTNWRPGVAESLGLSSEGIRARHPHLVWIRISGFGQDGPRRDAPAFDAIVQARTGLASMQGDGDPELVRAFFADKVSAMFVVQSGLAALHERHRTGSGAVLDLAMLDAVTYFNFPDLLVGQATPDQPDFGKVQTAASRPIAASDGWLVLAPVSGRQIASAFEAVERPGWTAQLKALTDPSELTRTMLDLLESRTRTDTCRAWERKFAEHDVPCSTVLDVQAHLDDAQVVHNQIYLELHDPTIGRMRRVRYPSIVNGLPDTDPGQPSPPVTTGAV